MTATAGEYRNLVGDEWTGSVWTRDDTRATQGIRQLDFGCVWVNDHLPFLSEMPHGGFKQSGYGKDLSVFSLEESTRVKHAMVRIGGDA